MTHARSKVLFAGVIFVAALAYLAVVGVKKGWTYTLGVDTYLATPEHRGQHLRLCGKVAEEGLVINKADQFASFQLLGLKTSIPVAYHGMVPDLFKAGSDVVVEGHQNDAGVFESTNLMTKCASKDDAEHRKHMTAETRP